jgi:hypothetical protein
VGGEVLARQRQEAVGGRVAEHVLHESSLFARLLGDVKVALSA